MPGGWKGDVPQMRTLEGMIEAVRCVCICWIEWFRGRVVDFEEGCVYHRLPNSLIPPGSSLSSAKPVRSVLLRAFSPRGIKGKKPKDETYHVIPHNLIVDDEYNERGSDF